MKEGSYAGGASPGKPSVLIFILEFVKPLLQKITSITQYYLHMLSHPNLIATIYPAMDDLISSLSVELANAQVT